ncbi:MAG: rRNA ((967)-C(5))-methyltransferase [Bacillales bacterium]|jgi:16S rRNA (cytosine967-C5)-methyltransferase|nr:rRNA ((967)-C(5))-methyltransferase [Bacillales bacterium]
MKKIREIALETLIKVIKENAFSNLQLNYTIENNEINSKDKGLLTEITYGTIQRQLTLRKILSELTAEKKTEQWVEILLLMSLYQLIYLDRVPDHAVINEAVEIAKKKGHKGIASFVNGVLRSFLRNKNQLVKVPTNEVERISFETSHPEWLVKYFINLYGVNETEEMCKANLLPPLATARVNTNKISVEEAITLLKEEGYEISKGNLVDECIISTKGNLANSILFKEGKITIQDESSMLVGIAVDPQINEQIIDTCAAPGGKTTHIAEKLKDTGKVISLDLHNHKIKLINKNVKRLSLTNVEALQCDAKYLLDKFDEGQFDRVLVDAPCSGLGVINRKPEIKDTKTEEDIKKLSDLQLEILTKASKLLNVNGTLVYSTCTITNDENQEVISKFLKENKNFQLDNSLHERMPEKLLARRVQDPGQIVILPHDFNTDGFYIAALIRKG